MRIRRRTVAIVQTHQLTTVHLRRQPMLAWCASCRDEAVMLAPEEAAAITGNTTRHIYRQVEAGELHCVESENGVLHVCVNSLRATKPDRHRIYRT